MKKWNYKECANCVGDGWTLCKTCQDNFEIVRRLKLEHNKLVKLKKVYGLQHGGDTQLHLTNYVLTGKLNAQKRLVK